MTRVLSEVNSGGGLTWSGSCPVPPAAERAPVRAGESGQAARRHIIWECDCVEAASARPRRAAPRELDVLKVVARQL